jgi:hypothetical protein
MNNDNDRKDNHNNKNVEKIKTPPKRSLFIILPKMISLIPKESENSFKDALEKQLEKAAFTAPENIYNIWVNVQDIITNRFQNHKDVSKLDEWSIQLLDIWTNKENK